MPPRTPFARNTIETAVVDAHDRLNRIERRRDTRSLNLIVDGHGSPITTGIKGDVRVDFLCKLVGWKLVADVVGDVSLDVWKDTYDNFPPTIADSIVGTPVPSLVSQIKNSDEDLVGWETVFEAGDYLRLNVDSVDGTITRICLTFELVA